MVSPSIESRSESSVHHTLENFRVLPPKSSSPILSNKASNFSSTPTLFVSPPATIEIPPKPSPSAPLPTNHVYPILNPSSSRSVPKSLNTDAPQKAAPPLVERLRKSEDKTLRRLAPVTISDTGRPRVLIPNSVFQKGAELHKDFIICYFNGRPPPFTHIQNEVLQGDLSNLWTTTPNHRFSWQVNKLLKLSPLIYSWIWLRVSNGLTCRFWTDNWSIFGNLKQFLQLSENSLLVIPEMTSLGSLFVTGSWQLPPARSESQLQGLNRRSPIGILTLLCWQSCVYWAWTERNGRLHRKNFRSVDALTRLIDRQIRNRILVFRDNNPIVSSTLMQQWLA
uniref:Reverse transcriptase zinc-binding domain-containing protein n=1 Tax=Brassica oleracea TaxID=3712 RepID=A0A3P6C670_BRAOL|nr:unnamed protein product [Brassica oleracea]